MNSRDFITQYAMSFIGTPYLFGGDDPVRGFDCSGYVQEVLKSAGVIAHSIPKMNAQMVYDFLKDAYHGKVTLTPKPGAIVFFGKDESSIVHVGFCLTTFYMIEAGGGDATTTDETVASQRNAFIKIRPIRYRKDYLTVIDPVYPLGAN